MNFNRRDFLGVTSAALAAMASPALAATLQPKRILLRSSWQVVNIGDISHTPGVLALIEKHLPGTEVRLWASADFTDEVARMEHKRFPQLQIVKGQFDKDGQVSDQGLAEALDWCDFLLHGSGPSLVAQRDVAAFVQHTNKPFGVYGITYGGGSPETAQLISQARFAFFRDSVSLEKARQDGISCPVVDFAPDGGFACDLKNDGAADQWLSEHELQPGRFACCLTRARFTPYWEVRENTQLDPAKAARNEEMFDQDHAPIRQTIIDVVRQTDLKVLLCPEDKTQMKIGRQWIYDRLPEETRQRVVWRDTYWLTDEALSTYLRSVGVFGLEMHSPIMSIGNGIPAIVGRFAEQTTKGLMWRDIGLDDWLFDFDKEEDRQRYPATVVQMLTDREGSQKKAGQAREYVLKKQAETMAIVGSAI